MPHLINNTPAMLKSESRGWTALRNQLSMLRSHSDFCAKNVCDIEVCLDTRDATIVNEGYSKERISMSFEEFFSHTIDMNRDDMYLKDWHIDKAKGLHFEYSVPEAFRDDWLNWYWKSCRGGEDDYSFLYIGGKGTYTALHHDVCCSNSWSINLFGRKKWTLWAPSESHKLALHYTVRSTLNSISNLPNDIIDDKFICRDFTTFENDIDVNRNSDGYAVHTGADFVKDAREGCYDEGQYPGVRLAKQIVFFQGVDDVIFVPSGWYHQVENIADETVSEPEDSVMNESNQLENMTVSLNRNWFNGFCVREVWLFLTREFTAVRKELQHIKPSTPAWNLESNSSHCVDDEKLTKNMSRSLYSDYTPPMEYAEWHVEVDKLIGANAALNMKEFVELISARVMMMVTCRAFVDDSSPSTSHCVDSLSVTQTRPCAQAMRERDIMLSWSALLCPRYEQCVTDEDVEVYNLLRTSLLPLEYDAKLNRLSSYLPLSDIDNTDKKKLKEIHGPKGADCIRGKEGSVAAQSTALEYTCDQLMSIVEDMLSSDDFLIHLTCCLQSELEALEEPALPFDVTSAVLVIKSNLQGLQRSINRLKCNAM